MIGARQFLEEVATAVQIAGHLRACDQDFRPPLSTRVDIDHYAEKIARRARRIEAWEGDVLAALLAYYVDGDRGFISNMSVLREHRGRGVAGRMLELCLQRLAAAGVGAVQLEVHPQQSAALGLYLRRGFTETGGDATLRRLSLDLRATSESTTTPHRAGR